jgi:hypothetical protein
MGEGEGEGEGEGDGEGEGEGEQRFEALITILRGSCMLRGGACQHEPEPSEYSPE